MRLEADALACLRGGRKLFSDLTFSVEAGAMLRVTGRNGAGKSSLLRILAGLLAPAAGKVAVEGGDPERTPGEQAQYLGHQDAHKSALTVSENLAFWARFLGVAAVDIDALLDRVGLAGLDDLPAGYLSAGQRRRLSLARLLAVPRPIWLLDEPTTALDTAAQQLLGGLIDDHLAGGGLVVAATHGPLGRPDIPELRLGSPS